MYSDMHINVSLVPFLAFAPHLNGDDEDSQRIFPEDKKNQQQQQQKQVQLEDVGSSKSRQKKPKKAHSLVRKLSLSKFKTLPEPETRHTPEGGDSSRSIIIFNAASISIKKKLEYKTASSKDEPHLICTRKKCF